ncbi:radical SAM protein [Streptomyces sp. NPDC060085]|uniref:radical SAM protein n=1 Tax=Streptomyces sp. NPDC060085 TaxID=3347054 RepID=UPI003666996E
MQGPGCVKWDITYACPLRCEHCCSESGRRLSQQLKLPEMMRVADSLIELRPPVVEFAGGEPLLVKEIFQVAEHIAEAGIPVWLYTSGWLFDEAVLPEIMSVFSEVRISLDGATAKVHDHIRGRVGSFMRAMRALEMLDAAVASSDVEDFSFGVDVAVRRSNFSQLEMFATEISCRFPMLNFLWLGTAFPSGLWNREFFSDSELLDNDQLAKFRAPDFARRLQSLAPDSVSVRFAYPDLSALVDEIDFMMQVEPDGLVRAIPTCEETVGSLLGEPAAVLWGRAMERRKDKFVVDLFSAVDSMTGWAQANRLIDDRYGSSDARDRIARRPVCVQLGN